MPSAHSASRALSERLWPVTQGQITEGVYSANSSEPPPAPGACSGHIPRTFRVAALGRSAPCETGRRPLQRTGTRQPAGTAAHGGIMRAAAVRPAPGPAPGPTPGRRWQAAPAPAREDPARLRALRLAAARAQARGPQPAAQAGPGPAPGFRVRVPSLSAGPP